MVDFTLFEIHLDDASFEANAPFASTGGDEDWEADSESGGRSPVPFVLGLVVVAVVVVVARRLLGGSGESEA